MRTAMLSVLAGCLAAGVSYASNKPSQAEQENKTQPTPSQQRSPDAASHDEAKFKLLFMSNGVTGSGARWGGQTYETSTHTKVYLYFVYLRSRENAKKEYDDRLHEALRIVSRGTVEGGAATESGTTEQRAIIAVSAKRDCAEATEILATVGNTLRIVVSCSSEAAAEFDKWTDRRTANPPPDK